MKEVRSKELAYLLRHDKDYNFKKPEGWRSIEDLVKNHGYTKKELEEIVKNDSKGRYEFDLYHTKIRALQGHSILGIEPDLLESIPPSFLYHGTSSRFIDSILKSGITKQSRNHVHLSEDIDTAKTVGSRHGGKTVILKIDTKSMIKNGIKFFKSKNNVWLCQDINPSYFSIYSYEKEDKE